jgi:hypothetical protein
MILLLHYHRFRHSRVNAAVIRIGSGVFELESEACACQKLTAGVCGHRLKVTALELAIVRNQPVLIGPVEVRPQDVLPLDARGSEVRHSYRSQCGEYVPGPHTGDAWFVG